VGAPDKEHFRNYEESCGTVTGQVEKSIVALLDIDCNLPQVQNLAHSFVEFDELSVDPASNPGEISMPMVITDLRAAASEHDLDDSEKGLTSDSSVVVPPISLNEADLHLTALLRLLETIGVTELPTNGATLRVEDVQRQLSRLRTGLRFHSLENRKQSNLFNWLASGQPD